MKSMRQMINLMEGVVAVPGVGSNAGGEEANMQTAGTVGRDQADSEFDSAQGRITEKSKSEKQARFMAAAAHNPEFAKKVGMDQNVAKEFNQADAGTEQLSHAMQNDESAEMGAMSGDMGERSEEVQQALADFQNMVMNLFMEPETAYDRITQGLDQNSIEEFNSALEAEGMAAQDDEGDFGSIEQDDEFSAPDTQRNGGWDSNQDADDAEEFEEAFDLNNGYDDIENASGNDYFPNGADSPVVKATGPSGARHGDNPEQKKMQVSEVHKELVYSYRNYLTETAESKKKN